MFDRVRKLFLVSAIVGLIAATGTARADSTTGYLFGFSDNQSANYLILSLQGGGTVTLNNLDFHFSTCNDEHCQNQGLPVPNQGWYSLDYPNYNTNPNYIAGTDGVGTYRNFFDFNLLGISDQVTGATLRLNLYTGSGPEEIGYALGAIDPSITAAMLNNKTGNSQDTTIYAALGGSGYGMFVISPSQTGAIDFALSSAAVADINNVIANNTGYYCDPNAPTRCANFFNIAGSTFEPAASVPEPASLVLLASGLSGAWLRRRRK